MFTTSRIQRLFGYGLFTLTILATASESNAQLFQSRARHNGLAQRYYNQQNSAAMYGQAVTSWNKQHYYIANQGYSNAYQTAYQQAWSRNPIVRRRGLNTLERIAEQQMLAESAHGAYIQQSAQNVLNQFDHQRQQVRTQRRANFARVAGAAANAAVKVMNSINHSQSGSYSRPSHSHGHTVQRSYSSSGGHGKLIPLSR